MIEVTKIAAAGNLPFYILMGTDPAALVDPTAPSAPAGQSEKPDHAADTAEVVRQIFTNPAIPRAEDDEIQLEDRKSVV